MYFRLISYLITVIFIFCIKVTAAEVEVLSSISQPEKITPSSVSRYDQVGTSMALSGDGSILVLGAPSHDSASVLEDSGKVFIHEKKNGHWVEVATIEAPNVVAGDLFGSDVSISRNGSVLVIGAKGSNSNYGSAYIYNKQPDGSWALIQELRNPRFNWYDYFGSTVHISKDGNVIFIGAPYTDIYYGQDLGSVYVYTKNEQSEWTLTQTLTPASDVGNFYLFGLDITSSADGSTVVIAPSFHKGELFIYQRNAQQWDLELLIKDYHNKKGFAHSISLDDEGDTLAIAYSMSRNSSGSGFVQVRERNASYWNYFDMEKVTLFPSNGNEGDLFGSKVVLSSDGKMLLVSAAREASKGQEFPEDNSAVNSGAVYLFEKLSFGWKEQHYIKSPLAARDQHFGERISIYDNKSKIVISEPNVAGCSASHCIANGAAWEFDLSNVAPSLGTKLQDQTAIEGVPFTYYIPESTFIDPDDELSISLEYVDTPINPWVSLSYDKTKKLWKLSGTPEEPFDQSLNIILKATDGKSEISDTFSIFVEAVNNPPTVESLNVEINEDISIELDLNELVHDSDSSKFEFTASQPLNGKVLINHGIATYTPNLNYYGTDGFDFTVVDGEHTVTSTVSIQVNSINDLPVPNDNNSYEMNEDTSRTFFLSDFATDADGDSLYFLLDGYPKNGSVNMDTPGLLRYTPNKDFEGEDSFSYKVTDKQWDYTSGVIGTVIVKVKGINDEPKFLAYPSSWARVGVLYDFLPKIKDPDNDTFKFTIYNKPSWAQFDETTGRLWGVPEKSHIGTFPSVFMEVSDGSLSATTNTVTIRVQG